jgi:glycosyltransferase involved in cell wall biosynthesis
MYVREWYRKTYGKAPIYINYGATVSSRGADHTVLHKLGVEENRYVLSVGRLVPEKGVHHLISAFNDLETRTKYSLVIVGRNPYESTYESSLRRLAKDNVKFLGQVYGSDMENLFKGAYLYVNASELEGTSLALLSAMGFGNCVLVSDIPENLETMGDAGVSFRNGDVSDLREKMLHILSDPRIVSNCRRKAVERVARAYSWDSAADRMEQLYLSLIADS